jgi:hypothetical protein
MIQLQVGRDQPPVFPAANPTSKPRRRRADLKSKAELHPDFVLIDACIDFAMCTASSKAAFSVDPSGDNDFGAFHDSINRSEARKHLGTVAETTAKTLDGLRAKASLVSIILDDFDGCVLSLEDHHDAFLRSLADDIVSFQRISGPTDVAFKEQANEQHSSAHA